MAGLRALLVDKETHDGVLYTAALSKELDRSLLGGCIKMCCLPCKAGECLTVVWFFGKTSRLATLGLLRISGDGQECPSYGGARRRLLPCG